jgi:hypothetical protein
VPRVDRVHCERGLSRGGGNDIAFGEVSARLQLAHGRADDDLVEGIPQPDAIGALWGCGQPEVPRAGVLRGNVAVGVGGAMVRLIPDEQVGRRCASLEASVWMLQTCTGASVRGWPAITTPAPGMRLAVSSTISRRWTMNTTRRPLATAHWIRADAVAVFPNPVGATSSTRRWWR